MVERVARAIAEAHDEEWARLPEAVRDHYRTQGRAAIEAMREPTEDMRRALANTPGRWGPHSWGSVIDAALR